MAANVLVDASFLVAFLSRPDQRRFLHARCWSVLHGRCGFADHANRLPEDKTVASQKGNECPAKSVEWAGIRSLRPHSRSIG